MKRILMTALLALSAIVASAQMQVEAYVGISDRDFIDSGLLFGYDFDNVPFTVGGKFSCESFTGRVYGWNPTSSFGIFARVYTGKLPVRLNLDAVGEIVAHRSPYSRQLVERAAYLQPSLSFHVRNVLGIKLNYGKFGIWGIRDCADMPIQARFLAMLNTYSLSFLFRF